MTLLNLNPNLNSTTFADVNYVIYFKKLAYCNME